MNKANFFNKDFDNINHALGTAIAMEAKRLAEKYNKDSLTCNDLAAITGFGINNVREMMGRTDFPLIRQGNRYTVSVLGFVIWSVYSLLDN